VMAAPADDVTLARVSKDKSIQYLSEEMDRYHNRFVVYEDVSSAGNHFHAWGKIADTVTNVTMEGSWELNTHM